MNMKDKIVFWMGGDFTHFSLSYYLQKMYDCDLYGIIDITNKPKIFFQKQNLVDFKKTWFFHDHIKIDKKPDLEYLKYIEKKYDVNLWKLAINERIFYRFYNFHKFTTDEILSILESECRLFENILNEVKPDFFVTKEPTFHHLELFYQMCKKNGIKNLILGQPNLGYRCIISEVPTKIDHFDSLDNVTTQNRSFEELQKYLTSFDISKQIRSYDKQHANSKKDWFKAMLNYLLSENKNIKTNYNYFGRSKFKVIVNTLSSIFKKHYRQFFIDKNLEMNAELNLPFMYYPLGVDLERNLLINSPFQTNQIEIIRHIAKSLPSGFKLYVKENPSQITREWRSISEYSEIMNIPNVTLIHPSFNSQELIKNSKLVFTITGSSGFEAAFYGKPSIVFTTIGYEILPSVTIIKEIESLNHNIIQSLNKDIVPLDLEKYLLKLEKNSFEFDWLGFGSKFKNEFYYGGTLVDVDISPDKLQIFLDECSPELTLLASEHIKKIEQHKKNR
jgi:hypothetical protein